MQDSVSYYCVPTKNLMDCKYFEKIIVLEFLFKIFLK